MKQPIRSKLLLLAAFFAISQSLFGQIFVPPQPLADWSGKLQTEIFDLDSDGDKDILWLESNKKITWLENLGGGAFGQIHELAGIAETEKFYLLDFDFDDDSDLLGFAAGKVFWYKNLDGKGNFDFSGDLAAAPAIDWWIRDMDSDGDFDLVPNLQTGGGFFPIDEFVWFKNLGGGANFEKVVIKIQLHNDLWFGYGSFNVKQVFLTDWNADGASDVVILNRTTQSGLLHFLFFLNDGQGNFSPRAAGDLDAGMSNNTNPSLPWYGNFKNLDLDGDHFDDALFKNISTTGIQTHYSLMKLSKKGKVLFDYLSTGSAGFPPPIKPWLDDFTTCDLDGDGDLEFVAACATQIKWNDGFQNNAPQKFTAFDTAAYAFFAPIASGDLDGDGFPDVVCRYFDKMVWFKNQITGKINSKITLNFFWDKNENALREADEPVLVAPKIEAQPSLWTEFSADGKRVEVVSKSDGKVKIKPLLDPLWKPTTAASVEFSFAGDTIFSHDFGLAATQNLTDFSLDLSSSPTRCGAEVPFWLTIRNLGTTVIGGKIRLAAANFSKFVSADVAPDSVAGGSVFWSFQNLPPTEIFKIKLIQKITGTTGDVLKQEVAAALLDSAGAIFLEKNFDFSSLVRCSFDPNDKLVEPAPPGDKVFVFAETPLTYTIRFQNTGNDTAFRVRVVDEISPILDWSSLKIISASHPYSFSFDNQGQLVFIFDDILLPDSASNPTGSQGFVKYEIRARQSFTGERMVNNYAKIYFDGNLPVLTAPVRTLLTTQKFIVESKRACVGTDVSLGSIRIFSSQPALPVEKLIFDWGAGLPQHPFLENLPPGNYFLKIREAATGAVLFETAQKIDSTKFVASVSTEPTLPNLATGKATVKIEFLWSNPSFTTYVWDTQPPKYGESLSNLAAGTYRCTVTERYGCSVVLTAVVSTLTKASLEAAGVSKFEILPNPSRGATQILVETSKPTDWSIEVFNAQGSKVEDIRPTALEKSQGCQRQIDKLPAGVYFFRLSAQGAFAVKKLVVLSD